MLHFVAEIRGYGAVFLKQTYLGVRKKIKLALKIENYLTYLRNYDSDYMSFSVILLIIK